MNPTTIINYQERATQEARQILDTARETLTENFGHLTGATDANPNFMGSLDPHRTEWD